MADRLQWLLELEDRLSGPAARMERQLGQVRSQLKALNIEAKQNTLDKITDPIRRQRAELQLQRDKLLMSKAALDKTGASARSAGHDAGFFTRQLHDILHIAQIVGGALERVGFTVRNVMKAISFREGEMIGLQTFLGGKAGGMFDRLTDFAARTGRSAEEMVGLAKSLAMAGVAAQDIEPILKRIAGLNNISAGSGDAVARVIGNLFSAGKGTAGDIEALRGTPIKPEKIYEDFAEKMGRTRNRLVGQRLAEQIGSEGGGIGKNLLTSLILGQADQLGAGSKAFAGGATLEGRMQGVFTQMNRMFERLARSTGVRSLKSVLGNLQEVFNPSTVAGQKTLARLTELSNAIAQALDPLTGKEGRARMEAFFESLTKLLKGVVPLLEKAAQFAEILVRYQAGERAVGAPQSVGEEVDKLAGMFSGDKKTPAERRHAADVMARPGSRPMDSFNRGLSGAEVNVTVNVDARGSSQEDADHIANTVADRVERSLHGARE